MIAGIPTGISADASAQGIPAAVVSDIRAGRRGVTRPDISPAAEGQRLVQAFLTIPDPIKRAELIKMTEDYVRRAR